MKRILIQKTIMLAFTMIATHLPAQVTINGTVADANGRNPLNQVNVVTSDGQSGTTTRSNGSFTLAIKSPDTEINFSTVGYSPLILTAKNFPDTIFLKPLTIGLKEVNIIAAVTSDHSSPVVSTTLNRKELEQLSPGNAFPEVMRQITGVYATRTGGGFGDAKLNIRGFSQENITILLNGIPVNSIENGLVYWNNWEGLTEATSSLQVQKGIGASQVAVNSAGGTVNIITKTTDAEAGGSVAYNYTDYGNTRLMLSLSTGLTPSGWALSFTGSRTSGQGYIDGTYVDGWSYLLSAGKEFGKRHKLVFTLMGSPERHGQRNFMLTSDEVATHGLRYNKDWGSRDGTINNLSENYYHKPYLTINHYFDVNEKVFIATSAYATYGTGGGKWYENFSGNFIPQFTTASGQIDWEAVVNNNNHNDIYIAANGDTLRNFSKNVQTNFRADHYWMGVLSSVRYKLNNQLTLTGGIHGRYFRSKLWEEITDLLGGQYFIDDYAWAADGASGREIQKNVGDIIKTDNGATVGMMSGFGQLTYQSDLIEAFIATGLSETWYGRYDHYNYITQYTAPGRHKTGFDIKGGITYNLTYNHRLFINGGHFSRAPYQKFIYPNWNNTPVVNIRNEKLTTVEAGYNFNIPAFNLRISGYISSWADKSIVSREYQLLENSESTRAMISGLGALHKGVEGEINWTPDDRIRLSASGSIGDWKWKNNVEALLYNQSNQVIDTVLVFADGLNVGDAPQTQLALQIRMIVLNLIELGASLNWYDRLYADFDPSSRTSSDDLSQSWQLPSYYTLDMSANYETEISDRKILLSMNCNNVLNQSFILRGTDGIYHNSDTFTGFWGYGRNFSFSVKMSF